MLLRNQMKQFIISSDTEHIREVEERVCVHALPTLSPACSCALICKAFLEVQ